MTDESTELLIEMLESILDEERRVLLDGDLEQLGGLLHRKEELMGRLATVDAAGRPDLECVRVKIDRNQSLLNSAMDGIRAVANRMAELRRVQSGLETYDQCGRKTRLGIDPRPSVEKRA